jgi:pilus assembly protein CpaF
MELRDRIAAAGNSVSEERDSFTELKNRIHTELVSELGPRLYNADVESGDLRERVRSDIRTRLTQERGLSLPDIERLVDEITDDTLGHGPLEKLLEDDTVSEIMVNGSHEVWVERSGKLYPTKINFNDEQHLRRIINKIVGQVGRRIDESSPMVDARLPDGSRINAVLPPLSLSGPLVTIRKFSKRRLDLDDLVRLGTLNSEAVEILDACLRAELNILISGGTGSGKTTLLNAMSTRIPDTERIVTIEDAAELRLNQRHVLRLEARPANIEGEGQITIRDLVRNSLRMRPDRIVVGEVRGPESLDMLQAMNTGHDGSLSTIHANSTRDALSRLETMVLMAGYDLPVRAIRQQVASALDLMVHLERVPDGSRKVTAITEVQRMEGEVVTTQDLFAYKFDQDDKSTKPKGSLRSTGLRATFIHKLQLKDVPVPQSMQSPGIGIGPEGSVKAIQNKNAAFANSNYGGRR